MKWYDDSLPSVQTWENGWDKCMRIIIAPFVWVCMIISLSVCFWWLVLMCTVSAMSVHVLECVWLNLHYAIAWCHSDTHTHTVASDTPVHTTSPHEVSDFFGLVSYQGTRRLLSKSAWILHYKVLKEVTKKNLLSSAFTLQCIHTSCMWQHGCICALMYVLLTVTTGNHRLIIHTVGDRSSAMPSADTRSRLRGCR